VGSGRIEEDKTGRKYGYLTAITKLDNLLWECKCDCGNLIIVKASKFYYCKSPSCGCKYHQTGSKSNCWKGLGDFPQSKFREIEVNAKQRGHAFEITIEDCWNLYQKQKGKCKLTDVELSLSLKGMTASLDRIDSEKGYTKDNIQWVHKDVNYMKQDYSMDYYLETCAKVTDIAKIKDTGFALECHKMESLYDLEYKE
jgi:hypothetical protein